MASIPWAVTGTTAAAPGVTAVDVRQPADQYGKRQPAGAFAAKNTGATNSLLISFDNVTFLTIAPGESFAAEQVAMATLFVKASAGTTTFEIAARDREEN